MNRLISRKEYKKLLQSRPLDYCPFCDIKTQIVLKESKSWYWIANKAPFWRYSTLIIPKRHFSTYSQIKLAELKDFNEMFAYALKKYRLADLRHKNGVKVKKYLFLWTERDDYIDTVWKVVKPDHYHFHIMPDKEHSLDSIVDETAHKLDVVKKLGE